MIFGMNLIKEGSHYIWIIVVHHSKLSSQKIDQLNFDRAPHPPYSHDIAPSDFFHFGYVKNKLKGQRFKSRDELQEEIIEFLHKISKEKRKAVFDE